MALAIVGVQFFGLSRACALRGTARRPRRRLPRARATLRVGFFRALEGSPRPACRPFAAATCSPAWCTTSTRCRTCCCAWSRPSRSPPSSGAATVALVWWLLPARRADPAGRAAARRRRSCRGSRAARPRRPEARQAAARAELTAAVVDLFEGAPELAVNGALDAASSGAPRAPTRELTRISLRARARPASAQGLTSCSAGWRCGAPCSSASRPSRAGPLDGVAARAARADPARRVRAGDRPARGDPDALSAYAASAARVFE